MNAVELIGRITKDPELRQTQSGIPCCRFTIAVNRKFKNKQTGEYEADFISCVAWKQTAEFISRYFNKGKMIALEGSLRSGSYQDRNHPDVMHYTTEVFVTNVEFCGDKSDTNPFNGKSIIDKAQQVGIPTGFEDMSGFEEILSDGDVPF